MSLVAIPRDSFWAGVLTFLADACALTRHRHAAEVLYRHLLPYKGLVVGMTGLAYYGSADRYLGKLAEVRGDLPRPSRTSKPPSARTSQSAGPSGSHTRASSSAGCLLAQRGLPKTASGRPPYSTRRLPPPSPFTWCRSRLGCRSCARQSTLTDDGPHTTLTAAELSSSASSPRAAPIKKLATHSYQPTHRREPDASRPPQDRLRQPHRSSRVGAHSHGLTGG